MSPGVEKPAPHPGVGGGSSIGCEGTYRDWWPLRLGRWWFSRLIGGNSGIELETSGIGVQGSSASCSAFACQTHLQQCHQLHQATEREQTGGRGEVVNRPTKTLQIVGSFGESAIVPPPTPNHSSVKSTSSFNFLNIYLWFPLDSVFYFLFSNWRLSLLGKRFRKRGMG